MTTQTTEAEIIAANRIAARGIVEMHLNSPEIRSRLAAGYGLDDVMNRDEWSEFLCDGWGSGPDNEDSRDEQWELLVDVAEELLAE